MTALSKYSRIEATALWRQYPEAQRREVIVSIGDATLVITNINDQALTHWSLAAVMRANPGQPIAIFHPDGDPGETLEFAEDEAEMIAAIEKLRISIARRRPRRGRLRFGILLTSVLVIAALGFFWLPNALRTHTLTIVPAVKRVEIGTKLLKQLEPMTGVPCQNPNGTAALSRLSDRLFGSASPVRLTVVPTALQSVVALPGQRILLSRALTENSEAPDILAGYILAGAAQGAAYDPLEAMLKHAGLIETFRLLTTGTLGSDALRAFAGFLLTAPVQPASNADLLTSFERAQIRSSPYAYALDRSGQQNLTLIEADPFKRTQPPIVTSDADWIRIQNICFD